MFSFLNNFPSKFVDIVESWRGNIDKINTERELGRKFDFKYRIGLYVRLNWASLCRVSQSPTPLYKLMTWLATSSRRIFQSSFSNHFQIRTWILLHWLPYLVSIHVTTHHSLQHSTHRNLSHNSSSWNILQLSKYF